MKSKFQMTCEECGLKVPVLNEIECFYYCNNCADMLIRASRIEVFDEFDEPVPVKRPDFDF